MDQEKISKLIKDIRIKNKLTQKEFAEKYNVTYQAVSKWENAKNIPDVSILKQISKDFNVSLDDILEGQYNKKNKDRKLFYIVSLIIIFIILAVLLLIIINSNKDFKFKTISSKCQNFNISGSLSYNNSKSAIYITNINYCGIENNTKYDSIECTLYEKDNDIQTIVSTYKYSNQPPVTLDEFLKKVTFSVDNYNRICKNYLKDSFLLVIKANNGEYVTTYDIPLSIDETCN